MSNDPICMDDLVLSAIKGGNIKFLTEISPFNCNFIHMLWATKYPNILAYLADHYDIGQILQQGDFDIYVRVYIARWILHVRPHLWHQIPEFLLEHSWEFADSSIMILNLKNELFRSFKAFNSKY